MERIVILFFASVLLVGCTSAATPTPQAPVSPTGFSMTASPTPPAPTVTSPTAAPSPTVRPTEAVSPTAATKPSTETPGPVATVPAAPPRRALTCGAVVRESLTLANDLTCEGDALIVDASGITVDLGGRALRGPGTGSPTWPRPNLKSAGVRVSGHDNVTIRNGYLVQFSTAILLDKTTGSVVEGVDSRENYYGIYVHASEGNHIRSSKFITNVYGLTLFEASRNRIEGNEANLQRHLSPGGYGIYMYRSMENTIVGNTFEKNVNWGIWLSDSRGNVFYHNNVIENHPQVSDDSGGNIWHDATRREGNYWADWEGKEIPGTGIGNHAYLIEGPGGATDPFPFVHRDGWRESGRQQVPGGPPPTPTRTVSTAGPWVSLPDANQLASTSPDGTSFDARVSVGRLASNLARSPDGRQIYVVDAAPRSAGTGSAPTSGPALLALDADTGVVQRAYPLPGAMQSGYVIADRDSRHLHVMDGAAVATLDLKDGAWRKPLDYPATVAAAFASWKHELLLVANQISQGVDLVWIGGRRISYTIPVAGAPVALAANRAGTRLYVAVAKRDDILVVETEQYAVVDRLKPGSGSEGWRALATAPDGSRLYGVGVNGDLAAIDLATGAVRYRRAIGNGASRLAVSADGTRLYVGATSDNGKGLLLTLAADDGATLGRLELPAAPKEVLTGP